LFSATPDRGTIQTKEKKEAKKSLIEIQQVNDDNMPVPGELYRIPAICLR
jgi:hypothetical protein